MSIPWGAVAVGGALLLWALGRGSSSSRSLAPGALPTPSRYGRGKQSLLRARLSGPLGAYVRRFLPVLMPGGSVAAVLGFTSIGGADEDTAPVANPVFHEVGEFQTTAGPASGPAPNENPFAGYNNWGMIGSPRESTRYSENARAVRALVQGPQVLGRAAVMTPGGWRGAAATIDRAAVGMGSLVLDRRELARVAPALGAFSNDWNLWQTFLAFSAFSAGPGGAAQAFREWSTDLSRVAESQRFAWLVRKIALEVLRGRVFSPAGHHPNSAYTLLRGWQKLEAARQLAAENGLNTSWFAPLELGEQSEQLQQLVTMGAFGQTP